MNGKEESTEVREDLQRRWAFGDSVGPSANKCLLSALCIGHSSRHRDALGKKQSQIPTPCGGGAVVGDTEHE